MSEHTKRVPSWIQELLGSNKVLWMTAFNLRLVLN